MIILDLHLLFKKYKGSENMNSKIGFIGGGNMAKAMIGGMISSGLIASENIIVSSNTQETLDRVKKEFNIKTNLDNKEIALVSDYLILAVKPYMYEAVLKEIKTSIKKDSTIIVIAAGISIEYIKNILGKNQTTVKAMPNTPALVGEGMTAISFDDDISMQGKDEILKIFASFGKVEELDESLMDAYTAISGSSPAYVYMMIEAMADAGVLGGIPRKSAYKMASQAVLGSAKMVLDSGVHPGVLKDNVCSPGGTTIEAVAKLEEGGFRTSIIEAMKVCEEKSRRMSEK